MDKLKMQSPNLVDANIDKIAELFPNCITEDRDDNGVLRRVVDFDLLRQELSASLVEGPRERYTLNWPGKNEAILTANAPIAKTLRPCEEESVNFATTKNLYIEGDNLEVLKLLQETYLGRVKMICIDPPYNTGKDFIYDDDFSEDIDSFLIRSTQEDESGNRLVANTESNGRFHSDWITMMYSRIKLARNLLSDDGVIFVSIDDNELMNLSKICGEIFGADNCLGCITVVSNLKGRSDDKYFATAHNYLLAYQKGSFQTNGVPLPDEYMKDYPEIDSNGQRFRVQGLRKRGSSARRQDRPKMFFPIYTSPNGGNVSTTKDSVFSVEIYPKLSDGSDGRWRWGIESVKSRINELVARPVGSEGRLDVFQIDYAYNESGIKRIRPKTVWTGPEFANEAGTLEVKKIFNANIFDNPKPTGLIEYCLEQATSKLSADLILDFFSGSSTTAHAVMSLNAKDGGNRHFIMVQLPESCEENSEAFKAGYKTIAEIGKERIRRAGKKIKEEQGEKANDLDTGFRVFKVDTSNLKDVYYAPDELKQGQLDMFTDHIKPDRRPEDLLFQVFLDWGLDLTLPIAKETIDSKTIFFVDNEALLACFDKGINEELVKKLAKRQPLRAVFRDDAFGNDSVKINVEQIFKLLSPHTEVKAI